jgi:hypothetical protein
MRIDMIHDAMVRVIGLVETHQDALTLLVEFNPFTVVCSIRVCVSENGKGVNVTTMISPKLSRGSSFVKTIWKQLDSLFVNHLNGHADLFAHCIGVNNSIPVNCVCDQVFDCLDGLVLERSPVNPHILSLLTRPTLPGQSVFEVNDIKLMKE